MHPLRGQTRPDQIFEKIKTQIEDFKSMSLLYLRLLILIWLNIRPLFILVSDIFCLDKNEKNRIHLSFLFKILFVFFLLAFL